ncbi:hypothetical protein RIR_jg25305.t1 [Rhizophagus irregularis DAOM 181602=DAOM 197198]|nr:hypothetical protein RIR_jg25305.t1 [Rhizophagus irregularis DAOM 181602=DAOM 197198]
MDFLHSSLTDTPAFTNCKIISYTLAKVVTELTLLTTQFASMNSCITKLESAITALTPPSGYFVTKSPSYIPSSMQLCKDGITQSTLITTSLSTSILLLYNRQVNLL